jgi:hypothetical protein
LSKCGGIRTCAGKKGKCRILYDTSIKTTEFDVECFRYLARALVECAF